MQRSPFFSRLLRLTLALAGAFFLAALALVVAGLHDDIQPADLAVVLGNTVQPDGTPSARLAARLDRALELYRQGLFPLILVSGGMGREGLNEADVMRDYLTQRGVPPAAVLLDRQGITTYATAGNTRALMNQRGLTSVLVVTQYFHIPRTKLSLRRLGVEKVYSAHARYFESRDLYSIPRELVGLLRYAVRSYDAPPASPLLPDAKGR